jgi:glutamate dehydrogenase/leucine dehydrogenase
VLVEKLETVDAFVVFDFEDAPCSAGVVRCAPKVLVDGATWLARSRTYQFAIFRLQIGGASAAVNAKADARADAVASFVGAVRPWVESRRLFLDPAKGVHLADLEPLLADDVRPPDYWEQADQLAAASLAASAAAALDGLDGRTVAIEGFDLVGPPLAAELDARGARVVSIGTAAGTAGDAGGFSPDALTSAWAEHGADLVRELEQEPAPAGTVLGASVDVLVCGSKAGLVDHGVAAGCSAKVVVPSGPIPVTAKGLAVLRRSGVCVLPDFVTTAGPVLGGLAVGLGAVSPTSSWEERMEGVRTAVTEVLSEVLDDEHGPLLGACKRAEAFLRTWRPALPFGRPLA